MYWVYVICGLVIFTKMLIFPNMPSEFSSLDIVNRLVRETGVPNTVSGVIFRNRLYDTIFEVVVFTIAVMGVHYLLAHKKVSLKEISLTDETSIVLARLGATISALVAVELAIRGHLSPGGGFASGVAGGTAIGLIAISSNWHHMQAIYQRWHISILEKITVLIFIALSILILAGLVGTVQGKFGSLLSGGWIPILNILVAIKVALGSWAMILAFIRPRGSHGNA